LPSRVLLPRDASPPGPAVLSRHRRIIIRRFLLALQTLRIAIHRCKGAASKFLFIVVPPAGADRAGVLGLRLDWAVAARRLCRDCQCRRLGMAIDRYNRHVSNVPQAAVPN
jgi:hypothetical protein